MRAMLRTGILGLLLVGWVGTAQADSGPQDIIDNAMKAHGGVERLTKFQAVQIKSKGTLEILGGISFTQESMIQMPNKLKDEMQMEVMGNTITVKTVYDGKKVSVTANGQAVPVNDQIETEIKEAVALMGVMRLVALKGQGYELSPLGEVKVNDKPAVGIKVTRKGHRDVDVYFDKKTNLVAKIERRGVDPMNGQEFTEERIIQEYQDKDGLKVAKKVLVNRDGKKYLEAEVLETKSLEKIDDSEFKP